MKLEELNTLWDIDSKIDETNLGSQALETPRIHAKYLRFLGEHKLISRKVESDYLRMKEKKMRYYRGEMGREELQTMGWSQYMGNKPLKSDMEAFLETDNDLLRLKEKIDYYKVMVTSIESILREVNSRHWAIRSAIDYTKVQNGIV